MRYPRAEPQRLLNTARLLGAMESARVDVLVAATAENCLYVTGMRGLFQWLMRGRKSGVYGLVRSSGEITLVAPAIELDKAAVAELPVNEVVAYDAMTLDLGDPDSWTPDDRRIAEIAVGEMPSDGDAALESLGSMRGLRVAVDDREVAGFFSDRGAEVIDARPIFTHARLIKTEEEVRRLRTAVEITERGLEATFKAAREGISEEELGFVFDRTVVEHGGSPLHTLIGFGNRSAYPTAAYPTDLPSDRTLREGELIRWDVGCEYGGYVSDIARVAVLGSADREQLRRWNGVLAGEAAALAAVEVGRAAREIFDAGVQAARREGLPLERKHLGHGIGIDMYEPPLLSPDDAMTLQAGMVIDVELPYYELGFGGLQIEDTVLVTSQGCDTFNRLGHELFEL
jgi:Xaa-Pro aminopeptidase